MKCYNRWSKTSVMNLSAWNTIPIRNIRCCAFTSHYNLEVSSPGLDRPLFTLAHFTEFKGQEVKINLFAPQDGRRKFQGLILDINESIVSVDQDGTEVALEFSNIAKAKLVPDYDSILAGHKAEK